MTSKDAYATTFRLIALAAKLSRADVTARANGKALPPDFPALVAEAYALNAALGLQLHLARQRQEGARES